MSLRDFRHKNLSVGLIVGSVVSADQLPSQMVGSMLIGGPWPKPVGHRLARHHPLVNSPPT